jgi:hypothetical protein
MSESMMFIRYMDHVLFEGADHREQRPMVRETVGWLVKQSEDAVWLLWDRDASKSPQKGSEPQECGLVILRRNIVEMRPIV